VQVHDETQNSGEKAPDGNESVGITLPGGEAGYQDGYPEERDHPVAGDQATDAGGGQVHPEYAGRVIGDRTVAQAVLYDLRLHRAGEDGI